jgi:cbb3-type cytochrome oxidase maturation protein
MTPTLLYLLGVTVVFVLMAAGGILWAIKSGQFDDMDGPAHRILMDDDDPLIPFNHLKQSRDENKIDE